MIPVSMTFRYIDTANPDGSTYKRPAIPVRFVNGDEVAEIPSLVDSGADMSSIDYRWADLLKLDTSGKRTRSYGVTGSVETVISHVDLEIYKGHEHYSLNIPIRVLFVKGTDPYTPTLLGRKGFFDRFRITIDELGQKVILKSNEASV